MDRITLRSRPFAWAAVVLAAVSDLFQHTASSTVRKNAVRSAGRARLFKYLNGVDETGIG